MSFFYPTERKLNERDIEAYAHACYDILLELGIEDGIGKMYDPLTIEDKIAHSYVFDLKDGGRHHPFTSLQELKNDILEETVKSIKHENQNNQK